MEKRKPPIFSIVLFVFAGIILIYTIWAAVYTIDIISTLVNQNQLIISGNEFDLVTFFMSNVGQYLIYTIILFSLGWIYMDKASLKTQASASDDQTLTFDELSDDDEDEAFDEVFDEVEEIESDVDEGEDPAVTILDE